MCRGGSLLCRPEPGVVPSMASGIQIAIKGLSVSSWSSIDLR